MTSTKAAEEGRALMNPDLAYISTTLKGALRTATKTERQSAHDCFEHWRGECSRIGHHAPANVAHTVHEIIDERMQHPLDKHRAEVKCGKGCGACCHQNVDVFPQEAILLRAIAEHYDIEIDEARLARQAPKNPGTWRELSRDDRRCVFLSDDDACRVYEHRPGACRKYAVITDPDLCDMVKHPGGKVGIVFSVEAEIVHSAAMTFYGAGNMASMLLKAKGKQE